MIQSRITALNSFVAPAIYFLLLIGLAVATALYISWTPFPRKSLEIALYVSVVGTLLTTIALFFRPLFAKYSERRRIAVTRTEAPLLFALVERLAQAIGAPIPAGIFVDDQVNAYVNSVNGTKGLKQGKLELTIGAPLLTGLTGTQLASVIAHELGHFTQRQDMLRSYRVNQVSRWLSIIAYEPDALERKMQKMADDYEESVGRDLNYWSIYSVIWSQQVTRRFFAVLLKINSRLTSAMSRQMEFNADDHAVAVLGSRLYVNTEYLIHEMSAVEDYVASINRDAYQENHLLRDVPAAIAQKLIELSDDQRAGDMDYYVQNLGLGDASECLVDNDQVFRLDKSQIAEAEAFGVLFGDLFLSGVYASCGVQLDPGTWDIADHSAEATKKRHGEEIVVLAKQRAQIERYDLSRQHQLLERLRELGGEQQEEGLVILRWLETMAELEPLLQPLTSARDNESVGDFLTSWNAGPIDVSANGRTPEVDCVAVEDHLRQLGSACNYLVGGALARLASICVSS